MCDFGDVLKVIPFQLAIARVIIIDYDFNTFFDTDWKEYLCADKKATRLLRSICKLPCPLNIHDMNDCIMILRGYDDK